MVQVIHLDSCVLRALLDSEEERKRRSDAAHLVNSNRGVRFRISILAVGEVMGKMAEMRSASTCGEAAAELSRLLRAGKVELYGVGKREEAVEIASAVMKADHLITPADALLVSCALTDSDCDAFTTFDRALEESRVLKAFASERRVRVLRPEEMRSKRGASIVVRPAFKRVELPSRVAARA